MFNLDRPASIANKTESISDIGPKLETARYLMDIYV